MLFLKGAECYAPPKKSVIWLSTSEVMTSLGVE